VERIGQERAEEGQEAKSNLLQLIAAPFAVLSYLLAPLIIYGLAVIAFKYAYGIQLPKPFGWFH